MIFLGNILGDFIYDGFRRLRTKHFTALHKPGIGNMFVQLSPLSLKLFSSVVTGCFSCVCQMTAQEGTHLVGKDSLSLCPFDTVLVEQWPENLFGHCEFKDSSLLNKNSVFLDSS